MSLTKEEKRIRVKKRVRKKITGTTSVPRLTVFKSNKQFYAQIINDLEGKTLCASSSLGEKESKGVTKIDQAKLVGKKLADVASAAGVSQVVFDRNGYLYHGRLKSFAESAREAGLKF